jgi:hypothetical protein
VKAGVFLLARFNPLLGDTIEWQNILTIVGVITMLGGALLAREAEGSGRASVQRSLDVRRTAAQMRGPTRGPTPFCFPATPFAFPRLLLMRGRRRVLVCDNGA